jgi:hypothetical protein
MTTAGGKRWQRLGELLIARRIELGGKVRTRFAEENGLGHDRTLSDLEKARRTVYEDATIAEVERIYRWAPGSIRAVLAGREPTPLQAPPPPVIPSSAMRETIKALVDMVPERRLSELLEAWKDIVNRED